MEPALDELTRDPACGLVWRGPRVVLGVAADFYEADQAVLVFRSTGAALRLPLSEWCNWLRSPDRSLEGRALSERDDLLMALPQMRERFPDAASLTRRVPWDRMKRMMQSLRESLEADLQWREWERRMSLEEIDPD